MKIISFILRLPLRIIISGCNGRGLFGLIWNFALNFSPVFTWLFIFKNAGVIPKDIRPRIHVTLVMKLDSLLFDFSAVSLAFFLSVVGIAMMLYLAFYSPKIKSIQDPENDSIELDSIRSFMDDRSSSEDLRVETEPSRNNLNKCLMTKKPLCCFFIAAPILLAVSYILLNFAYYHRLPITTPRDLLAWFSYVLLHLLASLFTAIWLYVFHTPGALSTFSYCLGFQNICGVITHLLFPTAPPWFIHLYGENATANYDLPGYAAGLTRVDLAMGTHLNTSGFHKSPIVFGALPSIHSAMAVLVFLFVSYYSRWYILKILAAMFVVLQWWATIYLDHHWRLDLFVGMLYSLFFFTIFKRRLIRIEEKFIDARLNSDFASGSTMGMRVFKGTRIQWFFDPYS